MDFDWDKEKDLSNQQKHGLSFSEVTELFEPGADYLEIFDEDQSEDEDRFIAIGPIRRGIVVVVYTEPEADLLRIIGARPANRREQDRYRAYMDRYI